MSNQGFDHDPLTGEVMPQGPQRMAPEGGEVAIASFGSIITAQKVAVARDDKKVMAKLRVLCGMAGSKYVYSWPVKDRKNKRETTVEGPTIKLANDLARTYGNCVVDVRAFDEGTHTMFYARFVDLETGYSYTRPFRQRKDQKTGMRDSARAADIVFQIGASKAIRNCVVNALSTFVDYMMDESKKNLLLWCENNEERAREYITKTREKYDIELPRIEAVVGRKEADWILRDIARVMMEMRGLEDGMVSPADLYPTDADAEEMMAEKGAAKLDRLAEDADKEKEPEAKPAAKKAAKKAPTKKAAKKAAAKETEPEPGPAEPDPENEPRHNESTQDDPHAPEEPEPEAEADDTEEDTDDDDDDGVSLFGDDS